MKKFLAPILIMVPLTVSAGGVWTQPGNITGLEEYGSGIRVYGIDLSSNPAQCASTLLALPLSTDGDQERNRYNSMILSAFMANKRIALKLTDVSCNQQGYPEYYAVKVLP